MIDTNYFFENKFDTKRIILKDFKKMIEDKLGVFIYNDVLIGEYRRNLEEYTNYTKQGFKAFLRDNKTLNNAIPMFGEEGVNKKVEKYEKEFLTPYVDTFFEYLEFIKGIDILIKNINIESILEKYFNIEPPFEVNENKKSEFPDAIIFESVRNWINEGTIFDKGKDTLYFVTKDEGLKKAFELTLVQVVDDLKYCLLSSSLEKEIERKVKDNVESDEFSDFLENLLDKNLKNYLMEGDLNLYNEGIEAEAVEYNIVGIGNIHYSLLAVSRYGEELKVLIEVTDVELHLDVDYMEELSDSGYYDRETGEIFGLEVEEARYDIEANLKLIVEFTISEKNIFSKRLRCSIEDIEKEPNPILQDDLYSYQYNLDALNDSVSIEIENLKISEKEKKRSLEYLDDPTSVF
ncbi:hypothetical protein DG37_15075 [Listeria monocytogenes]|nr:hypothetical protein [Listeria monocytogenes]